MIVTMINNSIDFIRTVASFFSSGVGLIFAGLILLIFISGTVKSLIS